MSQFYELDAPEYGTDRAETLANPFRQIESFIMPGIKCSACGETWAGVRRRYMAMDDSLKSALNGFPVDEKTWFALRQRVMDSTRTADADDFQPGDLYGDPVFEVRGPLKYDFAHPFPGQLIVTDRVRVALEEAGLTGYTALRVQLVPSRRSKTYRSTESLPDYYELMIHGYARWVGSPEKPLIECNVCKRETQPNPVRTPIDVASWDGTDLFNIDRNPTSVYASERAANTILRHKFSNVVALPV